MAILIANWLDKSMVNRQSPFSDGFLGMIPIRLRVGILGILGPSIGGKKKRCSLMEVGKLRTTCDEFLHFCYFLEFWSRGLKHIETILPETMKPFPYIPTAPTAQNDSPNLGCDYKLHHSLGMEFYFSTLTSP